MLLQKSVHRPAQFQFVPIRCILPIAFLNGRKIGGIFRCLHRCVHPHLTYFNRIIRRCHYRPFRLTVNLTRRHIKHNISNHSKGQQPAQGKKPNHTPSQRSLRPHFLIRTALPFHTSLPLHTSPLFIPRDYTFSFSIHRSPIGKAPDNFG